MLQSIPSQQGDTMMQSEIEQAIKSIINDPTAETIFRITDSPVVIISQSMCAYLLELEHRAFAQYVGVDQKSMNMWLTKSSESVTITT